MLRSLPGVKGAYAPSRVPSRKGRGGRLSARAALALWVLLSALGWVAVYYGFSLVF